MSLIDNGTIMYLNLSFSIEPFGFVPKKRKLGKMSGLSRLLRDTESSKYQSEREKERKERNKIFIIWIDIND